MQKDVSPREFDYVMDKLRTFFRSKGFIETPTQHRVSILAACEDPETIAAFPYYGYTWPLPQTGQMHLEDDLLNDPTLPGLFCNTTSYRNEPDPQPGRHDKIFQMFEVEFPGGKDVLLDIQMEMLEFLGFGLRDKYVVKSYSELADYYNVATLTSAHETQMEHDFGPVVFITDFPFHTSPFWNMKADSATGTAHKIDVIINGIETIGSAERSTNPKEMKHHFLTISDGKYAKRLYQNFGTERVLGELAEFLKHNFIVRSGWGMGVPRLVGGMKKHGILPDFS